MNEYGQQARSHWRTWRPTAYAAAQASEAGEEAFFTELGEQVAEEIGEGTRRRVSAAMAAGELPADYEARAARENMIRFEVEGEVLRDRVLLPPEPGAESSGDLDEPEGSDTPGGGAVFDPEFEQWREDTLADLAGGDRDVTELSASELRRLREATDDPRLRELAGITDAQLRERGIEV